MRPLKNIIVVTPEHAIFAAFATRQTAKRRPRASDGWVRPLLKARLRWREIDTAIVPALVLLPPGFWQQAAPRMDAVPSLGQHTDASLQNYGYITDQIASLSSEGVF